MAAAERAPLPYAIDATGVRLAVRLTPCAGRDGLDGIVTGADGRPALHLRLAAPPVEGAANKALVAFLAARLGVRKADVAIRSGKTARRKILHIDGDGPALVTRIAAWIGDG